MNKAVIAVGSNIEPEKNIETAREILGRQQCLISQSSFVKTKPQGYADQPDFLNGAFCIETNLSQNELTDYLKGIEQELGRVRTENKNGPRTIDLDIIVFNGKIIDDDFYKYDFVKQAVVEIMPDIKNDFNGINEAVIEKHFRVIMEDGLGLDMKDPNFTETPARVARAFHEIFKGLESADKDIHDILKQSFPTKYDGIVLEKDITVFSMCPHHFLPIRYEVAIGYIPEKKAIGLSKLARIIELMAKVPCMQETFTERIVDEIDDHIEPKGVICVVKGAHYCMQMRGVQQKDCWTTTSSVRGIFLEKNEMELKFYNLLQNS